MYPAGHDANSREPAPKRKEGRVMADVTNYNWRTIAIWAVVAVVVLVAIAWWAGAFEGTLLQPTAQAPQTETTTPEPETTEPEAQEPAQQQ
jgi:hypothetical protein